MGNSTTKTDIRNFAVMEDHPEFLDNIKSHPKVVGSGKWTARFIDEKLNPKTETSNVGSETRTNASMYRSLVNKNQITKDNIPHSPLTAPKDGWQVHVSGKYKENELDKSVVKTKEFTERLEKVDLERQQAKVQQKNFEEMLKIEKGKEHQAISQSNTKPMLGPWAQRVVQGRSLEKGKEF